MALRVFVVCSLVLGAITGGSAARAQAPPLLGADDADDADGEPVDSAAPSDEGRAAPTPGPPRGDGPTLPGLEAPAEGDAAAGDPLLFVEEFQLEPRDIVVSAAKSATTVQQAPAIITVITSAEIAAYGHRTLSDVLQTVPGIESDRLGSNGWEREVLTRGNPGTLLILWNGLPLNEPGRNLAVLDRKLPLEIVRRVEVTTGPGGVLWGSNALLGVVNIITRDAGDLAADAPGQQVAAEAPEVQFALGLGSGPGEQEAVEASLSAGQHLWGDRVSFFTNVHFFSSQGALLQVPEQKVLGVVPAPEPDGPTYFRTAPGSDTYLAGETNDNARDSFFLFSGRLVAGPVSLDWMIPWEEDYRQIATGGALLVDSDTAKEVRRRIETRGDDSITAYSLTYRDRFWQERLDLSARAYLVTWTLAEAPFGVFPPSSLFPEGHAIELVGEQDQQRYGVNLDALLKLGDSHQLIFGGEAFREVVDGLTTFALDIPCQRALASTGAARQSYEDVPYRDGSQACVYGEPIVFDSSRMVGALFLTDQWRLHRRVTLFGGGRLQASDSYSPTLLGSASLVVNPVQRLFLKVNYAEGLRPPYFTATHVNSDAHSGVTYQANPDLGVETSRSLDTEISASLLEGGDVVDRLFVRANYGFTILSDMINNPGGRFQNTGSRQIHALETSARLRVLSAHELWAGYTLLDVADSETGPVRNIANRLANAGLVLRFFEQRLELSSLATWVGPREDLNRDPSLGRRGDGFITDTRYVDPTDLVVDRLDPFVLWRAGVRVHRVLGSFDLSADIYDIADLLGAKRRRDPDLFFDDRVLTRPQPREGWSFFVKLRARL